MLRNEKGSFRGSSDQRGEHPGHLHNCRISEHGADEWRLANLGTAPGAAPRLARGGPERGEAAEPVPAGRQRGLPRQRGYGGRGAPGGTLGHGSGARRQATRGGGRGLRRARTPRCAAKPCPGPRGSTPPAPAAAVVKVVPVGIGSLLPPGDICAAEPARRLPGRLAGGSRPGGSHRHQRAGIKGLNGTLAPPGGGKGRGKGGGGTWPAPASRSPRTPPPPPAPSAPRRCPRPRQRGGTGRARGGSLFP